MPAFEPTKGLAVIACDETATVKILPAKVLHIADKATFDKVISGEQELTAKVEGDYLVLSLPAESSSESSTG
jgi:hypothetical protein